MGGGHTVRGTEEVPWKVPSEPTLLLTKASPVRSVGKNVWAAGLYSCRIFRQLSLGRHLGCLRNLGSKS